MNRCALWVLVACVAACGGSPQPAPAHGAHAEAPGDAPLPAPPAVTEEGTTPTAPAPSPQQREQRVIELLEGKVGEDQIPEAAR